MTFDQPRLFSADLRECASLSHLGVDEISDAFAAALRDAGATIVQAVNHHYDGHGLTCVLVLRESHAVLHTWPETGTVNIDIFSCSERLKSLEAVEELRRVFGAQAAEVQQILRADGHLRAPASAV